LDQKAKQFSKLSGRKRIKASELEIRRITKVINLKVDPLDSCTSLLVESRWEGKFVNRNGGKKEL
jgi:hypothetical protein